MTITYRKTKSGQWVAFGPVDEVVEGRDIIVTTKAGAERKERVESCGKTFKVDGQPYCYGYLDQLRREAPARSTQTRQSSSSWCDNCGQPGAKYTAVDSSGLVGDVCGRCHTDPSYALSFG